MKPILPGSTLGVLGAGQLGRMFALAAAQLGYRVAVLAESEDDPAAQVADRVFVPGDGGVAAAAAALARASAVVTLEFENVPADVARAAERFAPVRPGPAVLETTQDRIREKAFLERAGVPVTPHAVVLCAADAAEAVARLGTPVVLKTSTTGYDGRGQARVTTPDEAAAAWDGLGRVPCVAEAFVDFACEVSVVVARGVDGATAVYQPFLNHHQRHVLDLTVWPAPGLEPAIARDAHEIAVAIADAIDLVGVICVETFLTRDGRLLVNELAPRPHNSGHLTIEAAATSQFEQQVRAVCGLPLGSTEVRSPAAMANLLGDLFDGGEPRWDRALATPGAHLHLYGKRGPKPGRKMGHLTVLDTDPARAAARAQDARDRLRTTRIAAHAATR